MVVGSGGRGYLSPLIFYLKFCDTYFPAQVSKQTWCITSTKTIRLIGDGGRGEGGMEGDREIIYLSLHCRHLNVSCIKMGSDECQFNVSLIARAKSKSTNQIFLKRRDSSLPE